MEGITHTKKLIKEFLDVAPCATGKQITRALTGEKYRVSKYRFYLVEKALPEMVTDGEISATSYGSKLVYASRMRARSPLWESDWRADSRKKEIERRLQIKHDLDCTEGLILTTWSKPDFEYLIPERAYKGLGGLYEWGIRFSNGVHLGYEHSSTDNCERSSVFKGKIRAHISSLEAVKAKFDSHLAIVVFTLDVPKERVERMVASASLMFLAFKGKSEQPCPFYFVSWEEFLKPELGTTLQEKIYFWGGDYQYHSLIGDNHV